MKKREYEGKILAIPINANEYGLCLVARQNRMMALGYFFNKKYPNVPTIHQIQNEAKKDNIILIQRFSLLGLKSGDWSLVGDLINWKKNEWIIPKFKREDSLIDVIWAISYDEDLNEIGMNKISTKQAASLFDDGLAGYGFIEDKLNMLLK